jgi:magnesium chelatase family protein
MEDRMVTISRAKFSVDYPTNFTLIAAMNPCPCGYYNHPERECSCGSQVVQRYLNKVSGPLLDRIDLHVEVTPVNYDDLSSEMPQEGSFEIRKRVVEARKIQIDRFEKFRDLSSESPLSHSNSEMSSKDIRKFCKLDRKSAELLKKAMNNLGFSARAYDRILKVARTIADLEKAEDILTDHIAEAIQYRSLDRENWAG